MSEGLFLLRKALAALILPPTGPLLVALAGLLLLRRARRAGLLLAWTGVIGLLALSTPPVAHLLALSLDAAAPLDEARARQSGAIVVLGGGVRREAAEYGGDTLGRLTLDRVRYAARVARRTGLPVLVSGGSVHGGRPEAELMREALEGELGVPVRWVEAGSRNTRQNAERSAAILRAAGVRRVVLVTHAVDVRRAAEEFARAGIEVVPAPTGLPRWSPDTVLDWLPGPGALRQSTLACYELLALLANRLGL